MTNIILIFPQIYPQITGGAEIFNYFLLKELAKKFNVTIISLYDPKIKDVSFVRIRNFWPVRLFYPIQLFFFLCIHRKKNSIIYTSFTRSSWIVYFPITLFTWVFNNQYSFTIHGGGLTRWTFKLPYMLFFKRARTITGVSYRICEEYEKRANRPIKYLPPLIPFNTSESTKEVLREKYNLTKSARIILFVGSLKKIKNPITLLKAFNYLIKGGHLDKLNLNLVYVGAGPCKQRLIDYAIDTNTIQFVKFLGKIPIEDIHELYSLADLYVISSSFEGTPIALLEAMFNGLPILASDAPGINNILKDNESAFLFKINDHVNLGTKILDLLLNTDKSESLGKCALETYLKEYSFEKTISEYIKLLFQ